MAKSPATNKARIRLLSGELGRLRCRQRLLERQIESLQIADSPIQVGDLVEWVRLSQYRRDPVGIGFGRCLEVAPTFENDYKYRVQILSRDGRAIGVANINASHQPQLTTQEGFLQACQDREVPRKRQRTPSRLLRKTRK